MKSRVSSLCLNTAVLPRMRSHTLPSSSCTAAWMASRSRSPFSVAVSSSHSTRELAASSGSGLPSARAVLDQAKLVDETAGQDEQPLRLDQADGLLLDRPELGMRMKMPSGSSSLTELLRKIRLIS